MFKIVLGYDCFNMEMLVCCWFIFVVVVVLKFMGFWSKGVLVLQGLQLFGKMVWIKLLFLEEQCGLVKIGVSLDFSNKDSVLSVIGYWIVELGELDGMFCKVDIVKLKVFIFQDVDMLCCLYDWLELCYQWCMVFFVLVNLEKFLVDEIGNVWWWMVVVMDVNYQYGIDV